ncbi:MAG: Ku protein [Actinomycetota bacterium]|nr:MAG: Ku protein [Actinomycetota bacterium]
MRALWSGSLSFGLINVPVRIYTGIENRHGIEFNMLHNKDLSPIRYARVCRKDGQEIPIEDIVKGYEYQDGDFVVLTDDDIKKANPEKTNTITIKQFANESEIDIRYFDKPYYLEPAKGAEKPYVLLREALAKSGKIAVCTFVLRNREHLAAVKPAGQALVLEQMRFTDEIREPDGLKLPPATDVSTQEIDLALKLVNQLTEAFNPQDFHDTYTDELEEIIEEKAKGKRPVRKARQPARTHSKDLMAILKASLDEGVNAKRAAGGRR